MVKLWRGNNPRLVSGVPAAQLGLFSVTKDEVERNIWFRTGDTGPRDTNQALGLAGYLELWTGSVRGLHVVGGYHDNGALEISYKL